MTLLVSLSTKVERGKGVGKVWGGGGFVRRFPFFSYRRVGMVLFVFIILFICIPVRKDELF